MPGERQYKESKCLLLQRGAFCVKGDNINAMQVPSFFKRPIIKEAIAEFIGSCFMIFCGNAVEARLTFIGSPAIASAVGPLAWAFALINAAYLIRMVSGAHINPAMTFAAAAWKKLMWTKCFAFMFAQHLGGFVSGLLIYVTFIDSIEHHDGGIREITGPNATAHIFATYPKPEVSSFTCFIDQVFATALHAMFICAITDEKRSLIPFGMIPFVMGISLAGIIYSFAWNCMAPLNPARDFGPRLFTALAGWGLKVFSLRKWSYFWVPILGPHLGALIGFWVYGYFSEPPSEDRRPSVHIIKDRREEVQEEVNSQIAVECI